VLTQAGLVAHAVACLAFAGLALRSVRRGAGADAPGRWLIAAAAITALWAFVFVVAVTRGGLASALLAPAETLRSAAWIAFLAALLAPSWAARARADSSRTLALMLGGVVAVQLGLDVAAGIGMVLVDATGFGAILFVGTRMTLAIGGLVLVHNLYVNTADSSRWSVRLLCIALGGLFGYDLNLYTLAVLTGPIPNDLFNIRGLADTLVVPLIALSAQRTEQYRIRLSRLVVFQSFSLVGIGGYLVLMSVLGYGLRAVGGAWGRLLQIGFIFAGVILLAVVVLSGRFRAWARVQVNKNFFASKYDYRQEQLRFIATLSDAGESTLPERVVRAVCQLVDSPAGSLFTREEGSEFAVAARWNPLVLDFEIAADSPLARYLGGEGRIVNLDDLRAGEGHGDLALPAWAADCRLWLVVPLIHLDRLIGFIVMERSLATRTLNWEDYDLLRTAGRQAASYIAESAGQRALSEARKFDEFNRRFAFILHDIKNIVSQLSLVARNASKHGSNPEFQADMAATLNNSVTRMNDLLARLGARGGERHERAERVDLARLLGDVGARMRRAHDALSVSACGGPVWVEADGGRLEVALEHLTQNAIDASGPSDPIELALALDEGMARVEIRDHGHGMTPAFVRDGLFQPFHSTKPDGFGVGAYEAREIVRAARGRLGVASRPGEGSVFTILMPLADDASHRGHA